MTTHPVSRASRGGRVWFDGVATLLRKIVSGAPPKSCRACEGRERTKTRTRARAAPRGEHDLSEDQIDQASEDSFPASDPPSWSGSGL